MLCEEAVDARDGASVVGGGGGPVGVADSSPLLHLLHPKGRQVRPAQEQQTLPKGHRHTRNAFLHHRARSDTLEEKIILAEKTQKKTFKNSLKL